MHKMLDVDAKGKSRRYSDGFLESYRKTGKDPPVLADMGNGALVKKYGIYGGGSKKKKD